MVNKTKFNKVVQSFLDYESYKKFKELQLFLMGQEGRTLRSTEVIATLIDRCYEFLLTKKKQVVNKASRTTKGGGSKQLISDKQLENFIEETFSPSEESFLTSKQMHEIVQDHFGQKANANLLAGVLKKLGFQCGKKTVAGSSLRGFFAEKNS